MSATATTPARSLEESYTRARENGHDHREATRRAEHAFGGGRRSSELAHRIARARDAWDADHQPLMVGDHVDEAPTSPEPEPDAFNEPEQEIRKRIEELETQRGVLSLDALTDKAKANELAEVESRIETAKIELNRIGLARTEHRRREQAEREAEEQATIAAALDQASALQRDRLQAAGKVDRAARALGEALAKHQAFAVEQGQALLAAGRITDLRQSIPADLTLEGALAHGLAGAAPWIDFSSAAGARFCRPLAEQDPRHVEPTAK